MKDSDYILIGAVVVGGIVAYKVAGGLSEGISSLGSGLGSGFSSLGGGIGSGFSGVGMGVENLGTGFQYLGAGLGQGVFQIGQGVNAVGQGTGYAISGLNPSQLLNSLYGMQVQGGGYQQPLVQFQTPANIVAPANNGTTTTISYQANQKTTTKTAAAPTPTQSIKIPLINTSSINSFLSSIGNTIKNTLTKK